MIRWSALLLSIIGMMSAWVAPSRVMAKTHVVIVLDDSGSMADPLRSDRSMRKIDAAKEALDVALADVASDAEVGLLTLNTGGRVGWLIPLGPVAPDAVRQAIGRLVARGGTPLGQAIRLAADELLRSREANRSGEFRLLIVSDGEANDQYLVEAYLPQISARGLAIDVIGVDMATQHSLATQVDTYRDADDPQALQLAIEEVLAESSSLDDLAAEADFRLLDGLPDELCVTLLQALTKFDNSPLGEPNGAAMPEGSDVGRVFSGQNSSTGSPPNGAARDRSGGGFWLFVLLAIVVMNLMVRRYRSH